MSAEQIRILLADDDNDDCILFEEALGELPLVFELAIVNDGEQLIQYLDRNDAPIPFILFLDLNLPRKNGIECLREIKANGKLKHIHVVIYSTSAELELVNQVYKNGAQYYIRKPVEFAQLRRAIHHALTVITHGEMVQTLKENFLITGDL